MTKSGGGRVIGYIVTLLHRIYDLTIQRFNDSTWRSHSCFVILSAFGIRISSFLLVCLWILPPAAHAADNRGILGAHPRWSVLDMYHETSTPDEFTRLLRD